MGKGFRKGKWRDIQGTGLQGYIKTTYRKLVSRFGKPGKGDKYKTDAEWILVFDDGTVASVYNYKDGKNYLGTKGKPVSQITNWHVGGNRKKAVALVRAALR